MEINNTNYLNQVALAADYITFFRNSDSVMKTTTMQQLAELLQSLGNLNLSVTVLSGNTTLTTQQMVVANSAGVFNITLPASSLVVGRGYRIFNKGAGTVTILQNGSDTIAGATSLTLAQYASATLYSDGLGMWSKFA